MLEIITIGNDILNEKASAVSDINEKTDKFIQEMIETMDNSSGIGLAAPQVSVKQRIFVARAPGDIARVFINPDIIQTSQELEDYEEGCLSIPGIYANLSRPFAVTVQAWDLKGKVFRLDAEGILARIIQHELDHLNGILFPDRLNEKQREKVLKMYERKIKS